MHTADVSKPMACWTCGVTTAEGDYCSNCGKCMNRLGHNQRMKQMMHALCPPGIIYCSQCGTKGARQLHCVQCGYENPDFGARWGMVSS